MKKTRFRLALLTVSLLALAVLGMLASAQGIQYSQADNWRKNIDQIVKDLRAHHPDPFTKVGSLAFQREAEALKVALPALSEEQRVVRAMKLVASLGDGHTKLEPDSPAFALWYPIRLYEFTDGYFVTSAHKSVAELAGAQVLEIAGRPAAEVVSAARAFGFGNTSDFDPFLLLDDFRNDVPEDYLAGFPWHPHRGIETITSSVEVSAGRTAP